eukprot:5899149-Amphidinium_carterae.1
MSLKGTLSLVKLLGYAVLSVAKALQTLLAGRDGGTFESSAAFPREGVASRADLPNRKSLYFRVGLVAPKRGRVAPGLVP